MNKAKIQNNDVRPQYRPPTRMEKVKKLFLDNYWSWALVFVLSAVVFTYPAKLISIPGFAMGILRWLYDVNLSFPLWLKLVIMAIFIVIAGRKRESNKIKRARMGKF